jgi:gliding motility-associated-like protein
VNLPYSIDMKKVLFIVGCLFFWSASAQNIQVSTAPPNNTVQNLVQNILLGQGVLASNITFNGNPLQFGRFDKNGSAVGLDSGVVMGANAVNVLTGGGGVAIGASPDADLAAIGLIMGATGAQFGTAVIEFDFIPTADSLKFRYIFASQEYSNYTCSVFNDCFGFFLSGPGINGPYSNNSSNLALIPGTTIPVGVNSVNSGVSSSGSNTLCLNATLQGTPPASCWPGCSTPYFQSNVAGVQGMTGMTIPMTAKAKVQCGVTYHIKLAIANFSDGGLPSYVFLEAGSFKSISPNLTPVNPNPQGVADTIIREGCEYGLIGIESPTEAGDTIEIFYTLGGTAINGQDYDSLPGVLQFIPGQTQKFIVVNPLKDNLYEGDETVILSISDSGCYGGGGLIQFVIKDNPPLIINDIPDTLYYCETPFIFGMNAEVDSGGVPPFHYEWTFGNNMTLWEQFWGTAYGDDSVHLFVYDDCVEGQTFEKTIYIVKPDTCPEPEIPDPVLPELVFPNTFTPNGDGMNDVFYVKGLSMYPGSKVDVYNRWGTLVYSNGAFNNCDEPSFTGCWDGKSQSGQDLPDGVYFYTLVLPDGKIIQKNITLIRNN